MGEPLTTHDIEDFAFHRVDAARRLMREPRHAAEASGRLFFAKRVHEAAKAGPVDGTVLETILRELTGSLGPAGLAGARGEEQVFRGFLQA